MLGLIGLVQGVDRLELVPGGVRRLTRDAPDPASVLVRVVPDAYGRFSITLTSSTEVAGAWDDGWVWRCTEWSREGAAVQFAFRSSPGLLQYASVRPLRGAAR